MTTATLERQTTAPRAGGREYDDDGNPQPTEGGDRTVRAEWNHSCTAQCPVPCPYSNTLDMPEVLTMGQQD